MVPERHRSITWFPTFFFQNHTHQFRQAHSFIYLHFIDKVSLFLLYRRRSIHPNTHTLFLPLVRFGLTLIHSLIPTFPCLAGRVEPWLVFLLSAAHTLGSTWNSSRQISTTLDVFRLVSGNSGIGSRSA